MMKREQEHKAQRVAVFVDVQNMYYSARYAYDMRVNFKQILEDAVHQRILVRAIAYVIRAKEPHEQGFFGALEGIGYEIKAKDLQVFPGGATKGDWDLGIAMDMIAIAPKVDTVILVSGDGDYEPLLEHLRRAMGCRVEVVAFGKSASGKIRDAADDFLDLDSDHKRYLMPRFVHGRPAEPKVERPARGPGVKPSRPAVPRPASQRPPQR